MTLPIPIALQLYTLRDSLAEDFAGVVHHVAGIGYAGVEPFPFAGPTAEEAGRLFRELGLAVPSAHAPLPLGEKKNQVLDTMAALGCRRVVSGLGPEHFQSLDQIKQSCEQFNEAHRITAENEMAFGIHNHWWEFQPVNGQYVYEVMLEHLEPAIFFEIDTYWVKTAGPDPAAVIRQLGDRVPLLHIKDGPCVVGAPMTAVGKGILDFHDIVKAAEGTAEWLIVELDTCATNMMEAVEQSYAYLVEEGIGRGNKV